MHVAARISASLAPTSVTAMGNGVLVSSGNVAVSDAREWPCANSAASAPPALLVVEPITKKAAGVEAAASCDATVVVLRFQQPGHDSDTRHDTAASGNGHYHARRNAGKSAILGHLYTTVEVIPAGTLGWHDAMSSAGEGDSSMNATAPVFNVRHTIPHLLSTASKVSANASGATHALLTSATVAG